MSSPSLLRYLSLAILLLSSVAGDLKAQATAPVAATEDLTPDKAIKLAGLYFKLNQNAECHTALDNLLRRSPNHIEGLVLLGRLELREGHAPAAAKTASRALAASPDDIDATVLKAYALRAQGQTAEADALLKRVPPSELDVREDLYQGAVAAESNEPNSAAPITRDAADLLDEKLDQARAALAKNNLALASKLSAEAMKANPSDVQAGTVRAEVLSRSGKPAEAAQLLTQLKAAQPAGQSIFSADLDLASALRDAGRTEEARRAFKAIADNSRQPDEDRKQARQALTELEKTDHIAAGEKALERGDLAAATSSSEAAIKLCPNCPDAKALHARVLNASGHSAEAAQQLAALKAATPSGETFGEQMAYAAALRGNHEYAAAATAYQEVVAGADKYSEEDRRDARDQVQDLQQSHLGGGNAELLTGRFEEGKLWRATTQFATTRFSQTRYLARFAWDNVELSDRIYPSSLTSDVFSATVGIDHLLSKEWSASLFLGAHESDAMASGGINYTTVGGIALGLTGGWHDPARDTLLLTAMDGQQNAITATAEVPLGRHFAWDSTFVARQVEAEGARIGKGVGLESQFRWHPFQIDRDIYLAYALELKDFSPDESAFDRQVRQFFGNSTGLMPTADDAVPDRINRHALQVHGSVPLWPSLLASATSEIAWRQETEQIEFGGVAELVWKISERASINARLEYYSGGSGPNSGEDVILGAIGSRWVW